MNILRAFDRHWAKWGRWTAIAAVLALFTLGHFAGSRDVTDVAWVVLGFALAVNLSYVVPIARLGLSKGRTRGAGR